MARINVNRRTFIIIVSLLIIIGLCSMFWGVNGLTKNKKVVSVSIVMNDVKAGLEPIQTETLSTTDENEIKEILNTLQKPIFYKALPDLGGVPGYSSDFFEIEVILQSDNNKPLVYYANSHGYTKIETFNNGIFSSKKVNAFLSSNENWFKQLNELYKDKKQNGKWVGMAVLRN